MVSGRELGMVFGGGAATGTRTRASRLGAMYEVGGTVSALRAAGRPATHSPNWLAVPADSSCSWGAGAPAAAAVLAAVAVATCSASSCGVASSAPQADMATSR